MRREQKLAVNLPPDQLAEVVDEILKRMGLKIMVESTPGYTAIELEPTKHAKTLKIHLKVSDQFSARLVSDKGETIHDHDGYVPDFMPGEHYGDYVILDIDIDTGMISNWKKPTVSALQEWIAGGDA